MGGRLVGGNCEVEERRGEEVVGLSWFWFLCCVRGLLGGVVIL